MQDTSVYQNPLLSRYASREMAENFSDDKKFRLWRKLWIALAESEKELGLPITDGQIAEMKKYAERHQLRRRAQAFERDVRHDVMAHVKAFGKQAKSAEPIIHLGATSCYVTDNAEVIVIDDALNIVLRPSSSTSWTSSKSLPCNTKAVPTLGFTHLQPAQLTTVGKRATLVAVRSADGLPKTSSTCKAPSNSAASRARRARRRAFWTCLTATAKRSKSWKSASLPSSVIPAVYGVTGQTYPRKFDYNVLCVLSQIAQSAYRFSNDIRLLQHMKEIEEPIEKNQIGSSAMAYKRNPMRSERMGSLARYVLSLPVNAAVTASTQWFERTLDDSANKRIVIAQAFLAVDAILNLYLNISENLVVYDKVIAKHIAAELPFMATENIMMECVKAGGNRQELHERIRVLSRQAAAHVKQEGKDNDLIDLITRRRPAFRPACTTASTASSTPKTSSAAAAQQVERVHRRRDRPHPRRRMPPSLGVQRRSATCNFCKSAARVPRGGLNL